MIQTRPAIQPDAYTPNVETLKMPFTVFKVISSSAWAEALIVGAFAGSADDVRDGYIHLSSAKQFNSTLSKYFKGQSDLLLIAFDVRSLGPMLVWEPSRGGDLFPHFYGHLPVAKALWQRPLFLNDSAVPQVDPAWLGC